jgi:hypothetical protein
VEAVYDESVGGSEHMHLVDIWSEPPNAGRATDVGLMN